jgi:hypothetical protein
MASINKPGHSSKFNLSFTAQKTHLATRYSIHKYRCDMRGYCWCEVGDTVLLRPTGPQTTLLVSSTSAESIRCWSHIVAAVISFLGPKRIKLNKTPCNKFLSFRFLPSYSTCFLKISRFMPCCHC